MFREEFSNVISAGRGKIDLLNNSKGRYLVYAMLLWTLRKFWYNASIYHRRNIR